MWPFRPSGRLGERGERLAGKLLRRKGHKILARNYRCPGGEADLITLDRTTRSTLGAESIVIVEVKTRRSDDHASPESAVNRRKRRQLQRVAAYYLARRDTGDRPVRFDIVAVLMPDSGAAVVRHIPDAFRPG